jgi:hypothetical protein
LELEGLEGRILLAGWEITETILRIMGLWPKVVEEEAV